MTYTVLARRYRSREFDEVIGQEPIARTLKSAIEQGRVAHAYLFCGTRGVGKTSMARIFAKALNGGSPEVDAAIMSGQDTDVIEIDAASNNSVDNARDLIANSIYRPLRGKFKIYIIDEVHMLSTQAFNALLKTMEEPPSHVKFILCTTESQKVPATIQSRCQRFDFRSIPASLIAEHVRRVIEAEGREAEPELVHAIARLGSGSMRDALSILERVMAGGEGRLTLPLLEQLIGLPARDLMDRVLDAISSGDAGGALSGMSELLARGTSVEQALDSLLDRLRDLLVLSVCGEGTDLVELSPEAREAETARARRFDAAGLVHMIAMGESVQRAARQSAVPRALVDALMVRLAMSERFADAAAIVAGKEAGARSGGAGGGQHAKKA